MAGKGKGLFTSRVDNRDVTASARGRKTNLIVSEVAPVVEEGSIHSWNDDDFAEADRVVEEVEEDGSHESCGSRLKVRRVEKGRWGRASEDSSSSVVAPKKKNSGKDTSWIITDPVPGGPLVSHVIPSFGGHIARKLWDTPKDGGRPLKLPMSGKKTPVYRSGGILVEAVTEVAIASADDEHAQGYMAVLLGSTIFVDKSGDRIRPQLFPLLGDIHSIPSYSWGAGTLAYMYRQFGLSSRSGMRTIVGCLSLLQAWIFEYFPIFRPAPPAVAKGSQPRACCWNHVGPFPQTEKKLVEYRGILDGLTAGSVMWEPYGPPKEYEIWFQTVSHPFIIDPDHLDAPLPRDDVVVNIETANALLDQFAVARRMEDDAEQLQFFRRMMKDVGPLIDHRLSRRKPSKGPTPVNRVQREADGLRYEESEED
ncbi:hypothetical protein KSS87_009164 [Heliosperma pusillum]|nr:hypothetical protein KSS87_009164 [Heliosperma pusillum]